jgi:uncharacterized protein (TIGR02266 family)
MTSDREWERVPFTVQVEYRTASSFLVAYSTNLSRGGIFLESLQPAAIGTAISLQFAVPGAAPVQATGVVVWRREIEDLEGPAGMGIEFQSIGPQLGPMVDDLVISYQGISVLVVAGATQDRTALTRLIRSIISSAEVMSAADAHLAEALLDEEIDLVVVEADGDPTSAMAAIRMAKNKEHPIPTVALSSSKRNREQARAAGADELVGNPAPFAELQKALLRALGRPSAIR